MAITTASQSQIGQETAKNSQIVTTAVKLINSGGAGGSNIPTITSIIVTDSGFNNVSSNLTVSNSYIKIFGTNFQANSNVFVQNVAVSSANITFTNSTELRVALPRLNINGTNLSLEVTNPNFYQSNTYIEPPLTVEYLVVAGGGGGGGYVSGGGGAGGVLTGSGYELTLGTTYTVTVGAGGVAGTRSPDQRGGQGANSVFGIITSTGGGGGALGGGQNEGLGAATSGGSGGGGGSSNPFAAGAAGINGQGYAGGNSLGAGDNYGSGGGGGAGGVGETPANTFARGGAGGIGLFSSITGSSIGYAGGGGGGDGGTAGGVAGLGTSGGGNGGTYNAGTSGTAGTQNLGGGGGGNGNSFSPLGSGGSGVVIIRHLNTFPAATSTTGSPTITVSGGYRIYKFTSSGTITF